MWSPIGTGCPNSKLQKLHNLNALTVYRGALVIGAGAFPAGNASLWYLNDDGCWALGAGLGKDRSWGKRRGTEPLTFRAAREYVYRLRVIGDTLYVGFGASLGAAQIWRFQ